MPEPTPLRAADRNLLFGILALQMDFISRDALIAAMNAWILDKARPLGQVLLDRGALQADTHALLEAMVQKHLALHGNDTEQSLAALSSIGSARKELEQIADSDLHASLAQVSAARRIDEDSWATRLPSVGASISAGLRFRILRTHAKGGLGQVSVALDDELRREVALKEIQERFADDPESRSRFLLEAEVTGGLEHPGVVPVYGLGAYADGRPFYAMRFIRGDSLKEAIKRFHRAEASRGREPPDGERQAEASRGREPTEGERTLAFRQLLGRFVDVCQAVAYAHSRGVLHRDLKPGNVMLGKYGETLVVDWGLAKPLGRVEGPSKSEEGTLQPASADGSAPTQMGAAIGTPSYMSPEQAAGHLDRLGPVSDVYSLGATLYCLLAGRPPFEGEDLGFVLQKVQRGEFPRPRQLQPRVPPALEAVCLKAMALRPEDRYASALELAVEVEHWLADEPLASYREPLLGRAARWLRRHRTVAASALVLLLTATAGLGAGLFFVNAEKDRTEAARKGEAVQRESAEQSAADAKAVLEFFQEKVLAAARPESQDGGLGVGATIRAAVDAAEPKIAGAFHDRPLVEAAIRNTLGLTYWYLREDQAAIQQHERALALRGAHLGPDHLDTLTSMHNLAEAYQPAGRREEAVSLYEQALAKFKEVLGPEHPYTLTTMNDLGRAYDEAGRLDRALPLLEQALAKQTETLGSDHPDTLTTMNNLALAYKAAGQRDKAGPLLERVLAKQTETLGSDHPDTLTTMNNLATVYKDGGQLENALALYEQTLAKLKEKLPAGHPRTLSSMNNLAEAYQDAGRLDKAVPLYEETFARRKEKLGPDHPETLNSMNNLATAYWQAHQPAKALPLLEQALARQKERLGPDHPETLLSMHNLAYVYQAAGQPEKAVSLFERALAQYKQKLGPDHPQTLISMNSLAWGYMKNGAFEKATPLLRECLSLRRKKQPDEWRTFSTQAALGISLLGQKQYAEAEPLLVAGYEGMKEREDKIPAGARNALPDTLKRLVQLYDAWGQPDKAAQWRKELDAREGEGRKP